MSLEALSKTVSVKSIYWRCLGHSEGQKMSAIIKCHSFHMYSETPPVLPPSPTVVMTPSLGCHYSCPPLLGEATFMCACVFLRGCACSHGCKCTCVRIHIWGWPRTLGCPQECHLPYFRLCELSKKTRLAGSGIRPFPLPQSWQAHTTHTQLLMGILGIKLRSSCLHQALYSPSSSSALLWEIWNFLQIIWKDF